MDDIAAVLAKLDTVERANDEANERARIERESRERYDNLWCCVRYGEPDADNLIRLAAAIAECHKDGSLAVQRLADEYLNECKNVAPDFFQAHRLKVLAAKLAFCLALIEATKPDPDRQQILALLGKAVATYQHLDAEDVRQDLHSRRMEDVKAERAKRLAELEAITPEPEPEPTVSPRGKNAAALLAALLEHHAYDGPDSMLADVAPLSAADAAIKLKIGKGSVSRAFDQLFPELDGRKGYKRYCMLDRGALLTHFLSLAGDRQEMQSLSGSADTGRKLA